MLATVDLGLAVHATVAPASVTDSGIGFDPVTTLPPASTTLTTGCGDSSAALTVGAIAVFVNSRWSAGPRLTSTVVLSAESSAESVAVNVYVPTWSISQPSNVARPATAVAI